MWKGLWAIDAPPKLKHFLWKDIFNYLAAKVNLFKRRVVGDRCCDLCGEEESVEHLLLACE